MLCGVWTGYPVHPVIFFIHLIFFLLTATDDDEKHNENTNRRRSQRPTYPVAKEIHAPVDSTILTCRTLCRKIQRWSIASWGRGRHCHTYDGGEQHIRFNEEPITNYHSQSNIYLGSLDLHIIVWCHPQPPKKMSSTLDSRQHKDSSSSTPVPRVPWSTSHQYTKRGWSSNTQRSRSIASGR